MSRIFPKFIRSVLIGLATLLVPVSYSQIIKTVAGGAIGDGGPSTRASLDEPAYLAVDKQGNIFVADSNNHRIRKISPAGLITTVAGSVAGMGGDGGPADKAMLQWPRGVAVDDLGNLYISDTGNNRIRQVSPDGIITTIAGQGGSTSEGIQASLSKINFPQGLVVDTARNLYFAEANAQRVRKISATGVITTVAGNGKQEFSGDGGLATSAALGSPSDVKVDAEGNLLIADTRNGRVRRVATNGIINTVAGNGFAPSTLSGGDGIAATQSGLSEPVAIALHPSGAFYIVDKRNNRIRLVDRSGVISTVHGGGLISAYEGLSAAAVDNQGNLLLATLVNHQIRRRDTLANYTTLVTSNVSFPEGSPATSVTFGGPTAVAIDSQGNIFVADAGRNQIKKVSTNGLVTTYAGTGQRGFSGDGGLAVNAQLASPLDIEVDAAGNLYITDTDNHRVRKIDTSGFISTYAGNGATGTSLGSGSALTAQIESPLSVTVDNQGNVYILNSTRALRVRPSGSIEFVAGNGSSGFSGDGGPATSATLSGASGISVDLQGNLYIADASNQRIRKVSTTGIISTFAGNGTSGFTGDGGPATSASLSAPYAAIPDAAGNVFIVDNRNMRIRRVSASGVISTYAGNGNFGFSGDGELATSARLNLPYDAAIDRYGNLVIADTYNLRVRKIEQSPLANYQGAWTGGATENGWGLGLTQHGTGLVAGWYYYNSSGQPTWTIMPGCTWNSNYTSCTGQVFASTGAWLGSYSPLSLLQNSIGSVTFNFSSTSTASMSWSIQGSSGQKQISKLNFAADFSPSGLDFSDAWWGGQSENGWGIALVQQGGILVGSWYTYDRQGQAMWYLINNGSWISPTIYTAQLTRATGSRLIGAGVTYNANLFAPVNSGNIVFEFTSAFSAKVTYTVDGVTQTKNIQRTPF